MLTYLFTTTADLLYPHATWADLNSSTRLTHHPPASASHTHTHTPHTAIAVPPSPAPALRPQRAGCPTPSCSRPRRLPSRHRRPRHRQLSAAARRYATTLANSSCRIAAFPTTFPATTARAVLPPNSCASHPIAATLATANTARPRAATPH